MNRQPSQEGLLKMYQTEANLNRDKKLTDKQTKQSEERQAIDRLNRELEMERINQQNRKAFVTNERMTDYNTFMQRKNTETGERSRLNRKKEDNIAVKIGSENRTIKKKNYEESSNALILNPTREDISRVRNEVPEQVRGKSQQGRGGFNIISHTNLETPQTGKELYDQMRRVEPDREAQLNQINSYPSHGNHQEQSHQKEVEGVEHLENYNPNVFGNKQLTPEEEEYLQYYEYMRRKEEEERNSKQTSNQNEIRESNNINPNERPMQMYEEYLHKGASNSKENHQNVDELSSQMRGMSIASESSHNEYLTNKNRNNSSSYNNINHTQGGTSYHVNNVQQQSSNKKTEQQQEYRNYLNSQVQERSNVSNIPQSKVRLTKNMNIALNPYSTKNYEFGASALSTNPIVNPVNTYQFNYNKYRGGQNEIASGRLRNLGNNIISQ